VAPSLIASGLLREATGDTPGAPAAYEEARPLSDGRLEANRAMTRLRKAVDGGLRPAVTALGSPTFDPLRSRADFRDMVFLKDPFAR
jgi:hypothetical protein